MEVISYSNLRNNLAATLDKVNEDRSPVLITRQNGEPAVLISLKDFNAYEETAYLLASPKNSERLRQSLDSAKSKKATPHKLIEE
jgi:antitoxin YefM